MPIYFATCRNRAGADGFGDSPDAVRYLKIPDRAAAPRVSYEFSDTGNADARGRRWASDIIASFPEDADGKRTGQVVFLVHGFNTDAASALAVHKKVAKGLNAAGYTWPVISFDWPSDGKVFLYIDDRSDARLTANLLVKSAIKVFVQMLSENCTVQVHVVAHSMGAFVVREAFGYADDDAPSRDTAWTANQVCFVAGDVSSGSLGADNALARGLYPHAGRFTSYSNRYDAALQISNAKRAFTAPRVGRVGLPDDAPDKAINVEVAKRWEKVSTPAKRNDPGASHGFYFEDAQFFADLGATLNGQDRTVIATREPDGSGRPNRFILKPG